MSGYIKLHRSLIENALWNQKPFSYGQAWVDLLLQARHTDGSLWIKGQELAVKRGQVCLSQITIGERWGWSRGKVERYLRTLKTRQQIEQQTGHLTTIITICNYDKYQAEGKSARQQTGQEVEHLTGQQTSSRRATNKNVKNDKNVLRNTIQETPCIPLTEKPPAISELFQVGKYIRMTQEQYHKITEEYPIEEINEQVSRMDLWIEVEAQNKNQNALKYKRATHNHYLFALGWLKRNVSRPRIENSLPSLPFIPSAQERRNLREQELLKWAEEEDLKEAEKRRTIEVKPYEKGERNGKEETHEIIAQITKALPTFY